MPGNNVEYYCAGCGKSFEYGYANQLQICERGTHGLFLCWNCQHIAQSILIQLVQQEIRLDGALSEAKKK